MAVQRSQSTGALTQRRLGRRLVLVLAFAAGTAAAGLLPGAVAEDAVKVWPLASYIVTPMYYGWPRCLVRSAGQSTGFQGERSGRRSTGRSAPT